jgi:hypothetical protein
MYGMSGMEITSLEIRIQKDFEGNTNNDNFPVANFYFMFNLEFFSFTYY